MYPLIKQITRNVTLNKRRLINTSSVLSTFWESDRKGGYKDSRPPLTLKEKMRVGLKELKQEIAVWKEEVVEHFDADPYLVYRSGEVDVAWQFKDESSLNTWIVTNDSDNSEGMSTSTLTLSKDKHGLFSGNLSLRVPKDGKVKRAGYCNMKTLEARKSFKRDSYYDWSPYNMLVMRVRGDGRPYMLNIHTKGYWDVSWNDMYHYVLFTRGGPYWQVARIPFSKFFMASKGRVQDRQQAVPLNKVSSFGVTAAQRLAGEFSLEIDYIGLEYDSNHVEEFAYEMYQTDKYIVAT